MPTRYIGRQPTQTQRAKCLYEMCRQLRDFGVGRVFYEKYASEKWPTQKTYYRLTQVVPDMTDPEFRRGKAWGMKVFRGKEKGVTEITKGHRDDWILVPREEEKSFCAVTEKFDVDTIPMPSHIACPPLLEIVLKSEMKATGNPVPEKIHIPFVPDKLKEVLDSEYA